MVSWEASTVHSQQGSEADIVVFDTVNASNYTWPHEEWMRLVNVALSRANSLYVAMTRARSLLGIYGVNGGSEASRRIGETMAACVAIQNQCPMIEAIGDS